MAEFAARYYDGKTAARRDVTLRIGADGVRILCDGAVVDTWRSGALRLVPDDLDDTTVRLMQAGKAARLVVADPGFRDELLRHYPDIAAGQNPGAKLARVAVWGVGLAVAASVVMAVLRYVPSVAAGLVPQSWEERVGRQTVDEIIGLLSLGEDQSARCTGAAGRAALDKLTRRLSGVIDTSYDLHVTVVDIPVANAFAAPGGQVMVFRGLFDLADSPDAVAGVLAHEFGHAVRRHPTETLVRTQGLSILLDLLTGNMAGGDVITGVGNLVIGASYGRRAEAEADTAAVEILGAADISTAGLAAFFRKLTEKENSAAGELVPLLELISSHPRSGSRAGAEERKKNAATRPALSVQEWRALKTICNSD